MPTVAGMPRLLALLVIAAVVVLVVLALRQGGEGDAAVAAAAPPTDAAGGGTPPAPEAAASTLEAATAPAQAPAAEPAPTPTAAQTSQPIPVLRPHPPLVDIDGWLQSDVTSLEELRGKVVLVHFWTYSCHNCHATLPHLQTLYASTSRADFEIVGIHAPEFSFEEDPANVAAAAAEQGVVWPIALDTAKRTFHSWQPGRTGYWPRTMILDRDGDIRFDHIGEGQYEAIADTVARLVADPTL